MKKGEDYTGIAIVYFCHDGAGRYLFNKRSLHARDEQGTWDCGGGGLEFGDSVEETLHKEIKEEYCTKVLSYKFLGFRDVHREKEGKKTHWIALDFKVLVDSHIVKNGEPRKFDEIGWFTFDALPEPLHSQLPATIQKYRSEL